MKTHHDITKIRKIVLPVVDGGVLVDAVVVVVFVAEIIIKI